jgi:hypothetical protein
VRVGRFERRGTARSALGEAADPVLLASGDSVTVNPAVVEVDAVEFERLAREGSRDDLERAAALYRGELLEGLDVESGGFEEWVRHERNRLYELAVESAAKLLGHQMRLGQEEAAVQTAIRPARARSGAGGGAPGPHAALRATGATSGCPRQSVTRTSRSRPRWDWCSPRSSASPRSPGSRSMRCPGPTRESFGVDPLREL